MVWKRIMNRCKNPGTDTEDSITYEMLEQYLRELVLDLNLHLLCDRVEDELLLSERLVWVDDISIMAYEAIPCNRKLLQSRKRYHSVSEKIRDCFMTLWQIGQLPYP